MKAATSEHDAGARDAGPIPDARLAVTDSPSPATTDAGAACLPTSHDLLDVLNQPSCNGRCGGHGTCPTPDPRVGACTCEIGYTGDLCQLCAPGFVNNQSDGSLPAHCITPCAAKGQPCDGTCEVAGDTVSCHCAPGYEGAACDRCAPGFESNPCLPTCGGSCDASETCELDADAGPNCECLSSYSRGADGDCAYDGLMADPEFDGCAAWSLAQWSANGGLASAAIEGGELKLALTSCSVVFASTLARIPVAETLPHAALEIEAIGSPGARLGVTTQYPAYQLRPLLTHASNSIVGTGEWQRYTICMPSPEQAGEIVPFAFMLAGDSACAEAVELSFAIRSLRAVSQSDCPDLVRPDLSVVYSD